MAYRDEVLADTPFFYFSTETTGTSFDVAGGATRSNSGGVYATTGGPNNKGAFTYDGSNDYTTINGLVDFTTYTMFTSEVWFKAATVPVQDYPTILRRSGGSANFIVRMRGSALPDRANMAESYINGRTVDSPPYTYNDDKWHMMTTVVNGSDAWLYIDGVVMPGSNWNGVVTKHGVGGTSIPTYMGRGSGAGEYFKGSIAQVSFYSSALSAARIKAHYDAMVPPTTPTVTPFVGWGLQLP